MCLTIGNLSIMSSEKYLKLVSCTIKNSIIFTAKNISKISNAFIENIEIIIIMEFIRD